MTPERIAEIAHGYAEFCIDSDSHRIKKGIQDAIQEAIEEENKWYYPENGELPIEEVNILYVYKKRGRVEHGYFFNGHFFLYAYSDSGSPTTTVKCWRYAPEVPED